MELIILKVTEKRPAVCSDILHIGSWKRAVYLV